MTKDLRAILTEVAEGRLAPSEAAERLAELPPDPQTPADARPDSHTESRSDTRSDTGGDTRSDIRTDTQTDTQTDTHTDTHTDPARGAETDKGRVTLVRITASARPVRLVGDSTVATVTVDGPHSVRRDGATLRVEAGSPVGAAAAARAGSYSYERKTGLSRWLSQATLLGVPLTVRIHPDLAADAEVMAGSLELVGLRGPVSFSVTAGSVRSQDCSGPFTGVVRAGSARLEVCPTSGHSSVRIESGSVVLTLRPGSDVRVTGRTDLGEFKVSGPDGAARVPSGDGAARVPSGDGAARVPSGDGGHEVVVGAGTATFELDVAMGSAKVRLP
jgi:hypothetical protein